LAWGTLLKVTEYAKASSSIFRECTVLRVPITAAYSTVERTVCS